MLKIRALQARLGRLGSSSALLCGLAACGGGVPLLHSAHALPAGQTSFGAGMSDRLLLGDSRSAFEYAAARAPNAPQPTDDRYARGVLVALAEGPAVAPWVAARVGLPGKNEAGLSFAGQALRADFRHAFEWENTAVSAGMGVTGRGLGHSAADLPGADLERTNGFGIDVPLLLGYRTDADLISVWGGLRVSYDHWSGKVALEPDQDSNLSAGRFAAGPVLGLAVGLSPFWVAAELEVDYAHIAGTLDGADSHASATVGGLSLSPAGALIAKF